jgi:hypothetical protein
MTITVANSGTQTATIGTEHTLSTETTSGTHVLWVDLSNMVAGDAVELRVKRKVLTAGTIRQTIVGTYSGAQADGCSCSVPITAPYGATFTLKQTAGTGRAFDWSVERL